jgi:choline dehydrogenase-like flavoprotein
LTAVSVLVIENGQVDDSSIVTIPYFTQFLNTKSLYPITSAPEPHMRNRTYGVRVGNVVGGGSVVNGMQFDRGSDADYDAWEALGNVGWGWKGLEPYFKKAFAFTPPGEDTRKAIGITYDESAYGSNDGPLKVSIPSYQYPDYKDIFDSWREEDIPLPKEGFASPIGAFWTPNSIDNATASRSDARVTYYEPVKGRSNLKLLMNTHVDEIIFASNKSIDGKLMAKGFKITSKNDGSTTSVFASREVILSAGGVFTPHLLMISGIGPKDVLDTAKIPVKVNLPAVGSNFQDHVPAYMAFNLSNLAWPNMDTLATNSSFNASAAKQYEEERSGPWTGSRCNALAFLTFKQISSKYREITAAVSSQKPGDFLPERYSNYPTLLAGYLAQRSVLVSQYLGDVSAVVEYTIQPSGRAGAIHQKPLSRGTITLNTTHPHAYPIVLHNAFSNPIDVSVFGEIVRWHRKHWASSSLARFEPIEAVPGAQYTTDKEILEALLDQGQVNPTLAHPSCSCPMMPEELGGCVSDTLEVYGVSGLSVADASIMPLIPAAHLQATMYAVGEKAADIFKGRQRSA